MKAKNKSFKLLMVLSLLMCLVGINLFTTSNVFAADYGNKFITGHELTDDLGNPKTDFGIYDDVQAHWDFDIPVGSVSQGDTMSVNVPDLLTLSKDITFEIKDEAGNIYPLPWARSDRCSRWRQSGQPSRIHRKRIRTSWLHWKPSPGIHRRRWKSTSS